VASRNASIVINKQVLKITLFATCRNPEAMEKRTRTGCVTCIKRRVKCDEEKPFCARCRNGNFVCDGYRPPRRVTTKTLIVSGSPTGKSPPPQKENPSSEPSWRHVDSRQEQLPLYHHFVTTTVVRLFRNDHVSFWRDEVAQMSFGLDIVYEALLAISAVHRASLLASQYGSFEEASKSRVLGLRAYGNTLRLLPTHLSQRTPSGVFAVLIVLLLLTYFEVFLRSLT
jgi:hypothetical protein